MTVPEYAVKGPHIGEWCHFCKRWARWIPKGNFYPVQSTVELPVTVEGVNKTVKSVDDYLEVPWYD